MRFTENFKVDWLIIEHGTSFTCVKEVVKQVGNTLQMQGSGFIMSKVKVRTWIPIMYFAIFISASFLIHFHLIARLNKA